MSTISIPTNGLEILLGDSLPIITCPRKREAKVAKALTDKGFSSTKNETVYLQ